MTFKNSIIEKQIEIKDNYTLQKIYDPLDSLAFLRLFNLVSHHRFKLILASGSSYRRSRENSIFCQLDRLHTLNSTQKL